MSFEIELYTCPKCGKYKHKNEMLVNTVDKTMICIDCAAKLHPKEVKELTDKYFEQKEANGEKEGGCGTADIKGRLQQLPADSKPLDPQEDQ